LNLKGVFYSENAQEFDKLSTDFLKNAKQFFGARVTEGEIKTFLKTVPSLSQSDKGKMRVIENLRLFNKISELRKGAMEDIIAENNGFRPHNIESLVDKRTKEEADKIADEFKSGTREAIKYNKLSHRQASESKKSTNPFFGLF